MRVNQGFGLVIVKVRVVDPLSRIVEAPNALVMVGGATTVKVAVLEVVPVPPSTDEIVPVVLFFVPAVVPVTFTEIVHEFPRIEGRARFGGDEPRDPPVKVSVTSPDIGVNVPPQPFTASGEAATCSPEGRLSVKLTPERIVSGFGFTIVKVRGVDAFSGIVEAPNAFAIVGGEATVKVAVFEVVPVPPSTEEITPVVLFFTPNVVPVTLTEIVHDIMRKAAPDRFVGAELINPPVKVSVVSPGAGANVPPQLFATPGVAATCSPEGRLSVKLIPVRLTNEFGLVIVKLRVVDPLSGIAEAPNAFSIVGGATTVKTAVFEVVPAPPSTDEIAPVVLIFIPPVVPVTFNEMVHELNGMAGRARLTGPEAMTPLMRVRVVSPEVGSKVPPQVFTTPGVAATCSPKGRLSVKLIPVRITSGFGLVRVKVRVVDPLSRIVESPNALAIVGGLATVRLALAVVPGPLSVEVTTPVVLKYCPEAVPVTVMSNWHTLLTAMLAPDSSIPVGAVVVNVPPHTVVVLLETVNPVGNVSVNATPVRVTGLTSVL